jgi:hypothetical protein
MRSNADLKVLNMRGFVRFAPACLSSLEKRACSAGPRQTSKFEPVSMVAKSSHRHHARVSGSGLSLYMMMTRI